MCRDFPEEIVIHPDDAVLLRSVPYLDRFYKWERECHPDKEPTLRPETMFGEDADAAIWDLFVGLLFPSEEEEAARNPLFGYRLQGGWRYGLADTDFPIRILNQWVGIAEMQRATTIHLHDMRTRCGVASDIGIGLRGHHHLDQILRGRDVCAVQSGGIEILG